MAKEKKRGGMRRSNACKLLAILVFILSGAGIGAGLLFTMEFYNGSVYTDSPDEISRQYLENQCWGDVIELNDYYQHNIAIHEENEAISESYIKEQYTHLLERYNPAYHNFEFVIMDAQENVILQNLTGSDYQYSWTEAFYDTITYEETTSRMTEEEWIAFIAPEGAEVHAEEIWLQSQAEPPIQQDISYDEALTTDDSLSVEIVPESEYYEEEYTLYYDVTVSIPQTTLTHYITGYVRSDLTADDHYARNLLFAQLAYDYRYVPIIVMAAGVIGLIASLSFLLYAAGWRKDADGAVEGIFDRIPFDLFTVLLVGVFLFVIVLGDDVLNTASDLLQILTVCSIILIGALTVLWWLMSTAVRIRTGNIIRNNLIVIAWKKFWNVVFYTAHSLQKLPILWQAPLIALGFFLLQIFGIILLADGSALGLGLLIILYTAAIVLACIVISNMHLLEKGAEKIAGGDLSFKIPEDKLTGAFRKHGQNLNNISEGMNLAVGERIRSEMFKTELIANVSHDIRTPLTSIINYTDLLAKLELEDAQAQEYIEVLSRQSTRLRKLTEDVLEASKATTGNIKVQLEKMDLRVLIEQMQGEYAEKLETKQLELVSSIPETPLHITADGRLLWRVMDNLFGNICKYAMRGTRVYLDAGTQDGKVLLTIRNISAVQLHISADTLMERFVQGDRSRNTEGSGLGLSIAQSLTSLQGGNLDLMIDGDLFKVQLTFDENSL